MTAIIVVFVGFLVLIGVSGGVVMVVMLPNLDASKIDTNKSSMRGIQGALKLYHARHGFYPTTEQGLGILVTERFLDSLPKDAWGNLYDYVAEREGYKITSYGSDGRPGGAGAAADVTSDVPPRAGR